MKQNKKTRWWLGKAVWAMLLVYVICIVYLLAVDKQANLLLFINTITPLFILGMVTFVAYMVASKE